MCCPRPMRSVWRGRRNFIPLAEEEPAPQTIDITLEEELAVAEEEPEPPPEPVYPYVNPLTGEGLYQDISGKRPIAVMFNT